MTRNIRTWLTLAIPVVAIAGFALAQETPAEIRQDRRQDRRGSLRETAGEVADALGDRVAGAIRGEQSNDAIIAGTLIPANQAEVTLAQFALKQTKNAEVKEFAQQMINDHQKIIGQLRKFGGVAAGPAAPADADAPSDPQAPANAEPRRTPQVRVEADATGAEVEATPARPRQPANAPLAAVNGWDHSAVSNQVAQRCVALTKQMLQDKQAKFDQCYLGQQLVAHTDMLAKLEVFADYASPELRKTLDQGIEVTKQHLNHAEKLIQKLEQGA